MNPVKGKCPKRIPKLIPRWPQSDPKMTQRWPQYHDIWTPRPGLRLMNSYEFCLWICMISISEISWFLLMFSHDFCFWNIMISAHELLRFLWVNYNDLCLWRSILIGGGVVGGSDKLERPFCHALIQKQPLLLWCRKRNTCGWLGLERGMLFRPIPRQKKTTTT